MGQPLTSLCDVAYVCERNQSNCVQLNLLGESSGTTSIAYIVITHIAVGFSHEARTLDAIYVRRDHPEL